MTMYFLGFMQSKDILENVNMMLPDETKLSLESFGLYINNSSYNGLKFIHTYKI